MVNPVLGRFSRLIYSLQVTRFERIKISLHVSIVQVSLKAVQHQKVHPWPSQYDTIFPLIFCERVIPCELRLAELKA